MKRDYILVTPCRNEESNLPNLIKSIVHQSIKPKLWVIVDDCSSDRSPEIIAKAESEYKWIKGIFLTEKVEEYMGAHLAYICNLGFDFATEYCINHGIDYAYIALVDADNIPEPEYFEKLIIKFEKDEKLGIASGHTFKTIDAKTYQKGVEIDVLNPKIWKGEVENLKRDDLPMGSARIWRKECFEETGGYLLVHAPDSVSNVKAKLRGWKTKRFKDVKVVEREVASAQSLFRGYVSKGISDFHLWYPFPIALLKGINYLLQYPFYTGVAYLFGYIKSYICERENRIQDSEIKYYNSKIRSKEILKRFGIYK